jgi:CBS domain-containing protein
MDQELDALLESRPQRRVISIAPTEPVYEAIRLMAEENIGAVLVLVEGRLVGIVSERDYARKVILRGRSSRDTRVDEIMTSPVVVVPPEATVGESLSIMNRRRIRHLPVMRDDTLIAVVSMGDLVKWVISMQEHTIRELEGYITGLYPG